MACGLLATGLLGCGVSSEVAAHLPVTGPSKPTTAGERPAQAPGRPGGLRPAATPLAAVTTRRPSSRTAAAPTEAAPALAMSALNRRIQSGRIIDEAGQPLVGATVLLKGTTRGTSTDANGDYALPVPLGLNTFVVAYNGYQEEVAQSRDGQPLTVTLLPIPGLAPAAPEPKTQVPKAHRRKARS
jgi:hypothetical protein